MRRSKPQPIRNKLDLTDRTQVRLVRKRLGLSDAELTSIVERTGNSIAAISKGGGAAKGNHAAQAGRCASCRRDRFGDRRRAGDDGSDGDPTKFLNDFSGHRWIKQYIQTTP
ncbi:hypothetical protein ACVWWO_006730 [Bradyrhizobium sp. F1.13.1]